MSREQRHYDQEYKVQAIKQAQKLGSVSRAASELGMPDDTHYGWILAVCKGRLDIGPGAHEPQTAMTLNKELIQLRAQLRAQEKEIARLKKANAFLESMIVTNFQAEE